MADVRGVTLVVTGRTATGAAVVAVHGEVRPETVAELRTGLVELLTDGAPVLLDVSGLRMEWSPAPEVFVTAVAAGGGWPLARLVLFGADDHSAERLRACRVPESVPLAHTLDDAAALVDVRPDRRMVGVDLDAGPRAVHRAREALRETCHRWGVAERDDVVRVVDELVRDAAEHAGRLRLRLVLDRSGLRVSVRDHRPGPPPDRNDRQAARDRLPTMARLSRTWGVVRYGDGTSVWAHLPFTPIRTRPRSDPRRVPPAGGAATVVSAPRRRRFATADPENAHAFLGTVYGGHTLRLPDPDGSPGFHLEYAGVSTDRFAVERLTHGGAIDGVFTPGGDLVVVHPLDGTLRIRARRDELQAVAGQVVLCAAPAELRVGSSDADVEVVRVRGAVVARAVAELTGFDAPSVPFELSRPVSTAWSAHWRSTIGHLRRDVLANHEVMASRLARATVLRTLVVALVEGFPNPARDALADGTGDGRVLPRTVARAIAFIEEHAADDVGLGDVAAAAGVGARALQLAFRRHADTTPLEYLRRVRLERAHRDLQARDPSEATVGGIADRWGFPHHGNFSALYLRTYGRSPSLTLRS